MNKLTTARPFARKANTLLLQTWLIAILLSVCGGLAAQGFFKTYPNTPIDAGVKEGVYVRQAAGGFVVGVGDQYFQEFEGLINTDADGNQLTAVDYNFQVGAVPGDAPEYPRLALANGNFLRHDVDLTNHLVDYQVITPAGAVVNGFSLPYPAGNIVGTGGVVSIRGVGQSAQFADGDVFVCFYHGAPWANPSNAAPRTVFYAKVNPLTGALAWSGSFQGQAGYAIALPRLVAVADDQSVFMTHVEELPSNQVHFLEKISPTGQLLWKQQLITLERFPLQFAPSAPDGGVWFFFNQVIETVDKAVGDGAGGFTIAESFFPVGILQNGTVERGVIVPAPNGGVLFAGTVVPTGSTERVMFTMLADANGNVTQTNILDGLPNTPLPKRGIRLPSGEYVIVGAFDPTPDVPFPYDQIPFMVKLDATGAYNPPAPVCANNLLANPGFESGLPGWNQFGAGSIENTGYAGAKSLKLCTAAGADNRVLQGVAVSPSTQYSVQFYGKVLNNTNPGNFFAYTKFLTASFQPIAGSQTSKAVIGGNWTQYLFSVTAPANAAYLEVGFDGPSVPNSACAQFDEVCLLPATGGPCNIVGNYAGVLCNGNGTQGDPSDDWFTFNLYVNKTGSCGATWTSGFFAAPYGAGLTVGPFPISAGAATVNFHDTDNPSITGSITVNAPPTCSNAGGSCLIDGNISNINCSDNGTPNNPNDDTYTVDLLVTGTNTGNQGWKTTNNIPDVFGTYGQTKTFGPYSIVSGNGVIIIQDVANPTCTDQVVFSPPPPCSNGGGTGQIDLSLVAQQLTATPAQWSNYAVKLTLSNAGPQAATGVKVKFAKPNGVVYVGGNTHTVSQGTFNALSDEIWTVGSIPANGSATLTVNYFLLNASAPVAYAQVTAANETDSDSQPNNGTPPSVNEDDEASTGGGGPPNLTPDLTISDLQIPNASVAAGAILNYNFNAANIGTAAVPGNFTIKSYISTDQTLSANDVQDGTIQTGNYAAGFAAQNVAGASTIPASLAAGQYYLIVKIDADNTIAEGNENNNTVVMAFTVTGVVNLPDLYPSALQLSASSLSAGSSLTFNFQEYNAGLAAAGPFSRKSYISIDNAISNDDILVSSSTSTGLTAGINNLVTQTYNLSTTLAAGNYYLIVKVDADNAVVESNENNNTISSPFTVIAVLPTCVGNLLANPGFENGNTGWDCTTGSPDPCVYAFEPGITGNKLGVTFSDVNPVYQTLPATAGKTYSVNAKVQGSYLGTVARIGIKFLGSNNQVLLDQFETASAMAPSFTTKQLSAIAPAGTEQVQAYFIKESGPGNVQTDDWCLTETGGNGNPDCNSISIAPAPGQITIAGATAPHVLIKVFKPNWQLAFECLDNCPNPVVVDGLANGSHNVQVKLIDAGWGEICYLEQTVNVSNLGGGGGNALLINDDRQRLAFDRIYPNPAKYAVSLEVFSKDEQPVTLDFYDQQGRLVHREEAHLAAGQNEVEVDVSIWKSGTYNIIARGGGMPAYGRFLKVWEE